MKPIDMRNELDLMTAEYGLRVLYVRDNKHVKCKCYNPLHRTGDSNCKICNGFGRLTAIEPIKLIYDNNYIRNGSIDNKGVGFIVSDAVTLYMTYKSQPKVKDRIYITNWLNNNPEEIQRVYIISDIDEMRMQDGRIEGYMVTAKIRPDLVRLANFSLRSLSPEAKRIIGKGGKYIWPYNSIQN